MLISVSSSVMASSFLLLFAFSLTHKLLMLVLEIVKALCVLGNGECLFILICSLPDGRHPVFLNYIIDVIFTFSPTHRLLMLVLEIVKALCVLGNGE